MIISLLCPTRGRVDKCRRYLESALDTADNPNAVEVLFYVDTDDPFLGDYRMMFTEHGDGLLRRHIEYGPFITVSKSWNLLAAKARGDVLCMGNDDLMYNRMGWDTALERVVAGIDHGVWCAWFYDGIENSRQWPTFPMISRKYYETVGYFAPDAGFKFFYNDTWVGEVSRLAGCQRPILEMQFLSHLHHSRYPNEIDATTERARRDDAAGHDTKLFQATAHLRKVDAKKLRIVMGALK